jgi:hypothetical protein
MEGWFTDPYERHQARWMSQGTPTSLVRDGNVNGSDPPAQGSFTVNPVIIEAVPSSGDEVTRTLLPEGI